MKKLQKPLLINSIFKKNLLSCNKFYIFIFFALVTCIYLGIILLTPQILQPTSAEKILAENKLNHTIIIDAGHGGSDPGKVGIAGTLEKDINLKIALYLKDMLEAQDIEVIMTRDEDEELSTDSTNRKAADMKERVSLIKESKADAVISIHQNSYTDPKVYGAQCFYYTNSEEGKDLAAILQEQIISSTNQTKIREIKSNGDYYLLKHSSLPTVIAECGFLSNPKEEKLLSDKEYQRKMAWAIHLGILKYLNTTNE